MIKSRHGRRNLSWHTNDTLVEIYFADIGVAYCILRFLLYSADSTADFEHAVFAVENIALVEVAIFADAYVEVVIKFVSVVVVFDDPSVAAHSFDSVVCTVVADVNVAVVVFVEILEEIVVESVQSEG